MKLIGTRTPGLQDFDEGLIGTRTPSLQDFDGGLIGHFENTFLHEKCGPR